MSILNPETGRGYFRGRVALAALLRASGICHGDTVAIPAYSCSALAEGVFAVRAVPLYIDIDPETYNIRPEDLYRKINGSVRAVVVQHTYGIPASMDDLCEIAAIKGIPMIEDCCHTLHSQWRGRDVGTFGYGAFYSFEAGKPITTGIGGWARVNEPGNSRLFEEYSSYRQPSIAQQAKIEMMRLAIKILYRPSTYWRIKRVYNRMQEMGLLVKTFNEFDESKSAIELSEEALLEFHTQLGRWQQYSLSSALKAHVKTLVATQYVIDQAQARFKALDFPGIPKAPAYARAVLMRLPVHVSDKQKTLARAAEKRIELSDNYISPVHPYKGAELVKMGYELGSCPNAEKASEKTVSMPLTFRTTTGDINRTIEFLLECL